MGTTIGEAEVQVAEPQPPPTEPKPAPSSPQRIDAAELKRLLHREHERCARLAAD